MRNFDHFSLSDWLDHLENRHEQEIELGLKRIQSVAQRLNLLDWEGVTVITVGGTNGKGSTVAALESIYCSSEYCVGAYTSPHLLSFNERIRVNQRQISDTDLCTAFQWIEESREYTTLTYFETVTLAALGYFKQHKCNVIILEVGMGGRLDATNIVHSDLAIITTVDLDHQTYLGSNVEKIGYEKAGILRAGKPCIYADTNPPNSVIAQAALLHSPMLCLGRDYVYHTDGHQLSISVQDIVLPPLPIPQLNLKSATAAIVASHQLSDILPIDEAAWALAMKSVSIQGRQQVIEDQEVTILFDVAHNPQAARYLAEKIQQNFGKKKVHAVFAALNDKDLYGLIMSLKPCVDFWYPAILDGKRASTKAKLAEAFTIAIDSMPSCFDNPYEAYIEARQSANLGDLIIVYGSFLTVEAVMKSHTQCLKQEKIQ